MAIDKKEWAKQIDNLWSTWSQYNGAETIDIDYEDVTNQPTLIPEG